MVLYVLSTCDQLFSSSRHSNIKVEIKTKSREEKKKANKQTQKLRLTIHAEQVLPFTRTILTTPAAIARAAPCWHCRKVQWSTESSLYVLLPSLTFNVYFEPKFDEFVITGGDFTVFDAISRHRVLWSGVRAVFAQGWSWQQNFKRKSFVHTSCDRSELWREATVRSWTRRRRPTTMTVRATCGVFSN